MNHMWDYIGIADGNINVQIKPYKDYTTIGISIPDVRLERYYYKLNEGGVVVDKRPCVDKEGFVKLVFACPILDLGMPKNSVSDPYKNNITDFDPNNIDPHAYISLDLYLDIWRKFGAKIGFRKGDYIEWENGQKDLIEVFNDGY